MLRLILLGWPTKPIPDLVLIRMAPRGLIVVGQRLGDTVFQTGQRRGESQSIATYLVLTLSVPLILGVPSHLAGAPPAPPLLALMIPTLATKQILASIVIATNLVGWVILVMQAQVPLQDPGIKVI